jgi:rabenosyn-5
MSGRKLGGGRILGSGKSLAPPAPPSQQRKPPDVVSPSASTLSLGSSRESAISPLATSPIPDAGQDLISRASLENGGPSRVSAASSKLTCPICQEEMVS